MQTIMIDEQFAQGLSDMVKVRASSWRGALILCCAHERSAIPALWPKHVDAQEHCCFSLGSICTSPIHMFIFYEGFTTKK